MAPDQKLDENLQISLGPIIPTLIFLNFDFDPNETVKKKSIIFQNIILFIILYR